MLVDSLLIIIYLHKTLVVRGQHIEGLEVIVCPCYFVKEVGPLGVVVSQLVYKTGNRFLRLIVLFGSLNG